MVSSTIVASVLALAVQTASAAFVADPSPPDQSYPSSSSRNTTITVRSVKLHEDRGGQRDIVIQRRGPGGPGGKAAPGQMRVRVLRDGHGSSENGAGREGGEDRNVIIKRVGPGTRGENNEHDEQDVQVRIFKHRVNGPGGDHGDRGDHGNAPHEMRIEVQVEGDKKGNDNAHFSPPNDGMSMHRLPPQARQHIEKIIREHMSQMREQGPGRGGNEGPRGREGPQMRMRSMGPGHGGPSGRDDRGDRGNPVSPGMGRRAPGGRGHPPIIILNPRGGGGGFGGGGPGTQFFVPGGGEQDHRSPAAERKMKQKRMNNMHKKTNKDNDGAGKEHMQKLHEELMRDNENTHNRKGKNQPRLNTPDAPPAPKPQGSTGIPLNFA